MVAGRVVLASVSSAVVRLTFQDGAVQVAGRVVVVPADCRPFGRREGGRMANTPPWCWKPTIRSAIQSIDRSINRSVI